MSKHAFYVAVSFLEIDLIQLERLIDLENDHKRRDRLFIIAEILKGNLKDLIKHEKLKLEDYLFSSNRRSRYHTRSLQQILKTAVIRAEINKDVTPHTLRHSFATHLIENSYSVAEVQSLLGHKSPETTFTYLHTASPNLIKVKSPLDFL